MLNNNEQNSLQRKPERQKKLRLAPLLLLLGGVVIMGTLLMVAWQVYTTNQSPSSTGRGSTQGTEGPTHAPWDDYPEVYWQTLRAQVAQGLHMTEQQIHDNLHSTLLANASTGSNQTEISSADAAQWMSDLASAHGVSQAQLHTIEVTAVQKAHTILVNQHVLTQQQADENMHMMNQDNLNFNMVNAFSRGDKTNGQGK
ncbi:hypothetical protein [Ktedonobacter racemifer]|uniref:Uncharacterized protein n=1 Tax=Ktedonobacter racemifer DSM 44963 TaxID=485913 RepID=D6U8I2_KTERA|nr:hypothetical protein [Ktedonobacter racemifer]EFH80193.1 hypothetical protein Krac_0769 [Ktedonobacter racemifer DSM 44963]